MTHEQIQEWYKNRPIGLTVQKIADALGATKSYTSQVFRWRKPGKKMHAKIEAYIQSLDESQSKQSENKKKH